MTSSLLSRNEVQGDFFEPLLGLIRENESVSLGYLSYRAGRPYAEVLEDVGRLCRAGMLKMAGEFHVYRPRAAQEEEP